MLQNSFPSKISMPALDEISLSQFRRYVSASDSSGNITEVIFYRSDGSKFMKRNYSNQNASNLAFSVRFLYTTCTETFYDIDGITVIGTQVYTFTFNNFGDISGCQRTSTF